MTRQFHRSKILPSALLIAAGILTIGRAAVAAPAVTWQIADAAAYRSGLFENFSASVTLSGSGFAANRLVVVDLTSTDFANEIVPVWEGAITEEQTVLTNASGAWTLTFQPAFVGLFEQANTFNTWESTYLVIDNGLDVIDGLATTTFYSL